MCNMRLNVGIGVSISDGNRKMNGDCNAEFIPRRRLEKKSMLDRLGVQPRRTDVAWVCLHSSHQLWQDSPEIYIRTYVRLLTCSFPSDIEREELQAADGSHITKY